MVLSLPFAYRHKPGLLPQFVSNASGFAGWVASVGVRVSDLARQRVPAVGMTCRTGQVGNSDPGARGNCAEQQYGVWKI